MSSNPFSPPATSDLLDDVPIAHPTQRHRGPALYIAITGLLGGFVFIPIFVRMGAIAFSIVPIACLIGGLVFRIHSRQWPHDASVRRLQVVFSTLAITLPTSLLYFLAGPHHMRLEVAMIGAIIGVSVACGIFASGTRRPNETEQQG